MKFGNEAALLTCIMNDNMNYLLLTECETK